MTGSKRMIWLAALVAMLAVVRGAAAQQDGVNIFLARHDQSADLLFQQFTEQTGIRVKWVEGQGDALVDRITGEGIESLADVLVVSDPQALWAAEERGLLAPISSPLLESRIPENLRGPLGRWFGVSTRALLIYYNKDLIDPAYLRNYEDLADPRLRDEVCMPPGDRVVSPSLITSMIARHGVEYATRWARGLVGNFARDPEGSDSDQIRAVASGECGVSVASSSDFIRILKSDTDRDQDVAAHVGYILPNQEGRGTLVSITAAGVLATAPHRGNAVSFLEFLSSDQALNAYSVAGNEFPAVPGVLDDPVLIGFGDFKADALDPSTFGRFQGETQRVMDLAGWK